MNVSLTPELEKMINNKVNGGRYNTASEVVREGLRLLKQRDDLHDAKLAALRNEVQHGIDDLEAGRYRSGPKVMRELKAGLRRSKKA